MKKKIKVVKKQLTWKELVIALHTMEKDVPSRRIVEFLEAKGIKVKVQQVAAIKAHMTLGNKVR